MAVRSPAGQCGLRRGVSDGQESLSQGSYVGGVMRGAITLILALVLLVVVALDGYSMFAAFMDSHELALGAAQTAAAALDESGGNEGAARKAADAYAVSYTHL